MSASSETRIEIMNQQQQMQWPKFCRRKIAKKNLEARSLMWYTRQETKIVDVNSFKELVNSFNDDENFSGIPDNLLPMSRAIVDICMLSKE
jgi:hypothetical protein